MVFGFGVGLVEAVAALDEGLDFSGRKNEPILSGVVRDFPFFVHLENLGGVGHLAPFVFTPLGLDLTELLKSAVEQAGQALLVNADIGEGVALVVEGFSQGQSPSGAGFIGADGIEMVLGGEGKESGLGGGNAVEAPGGVAERLDELFFERTFGLELVDEAFEVALVGGLVLGGQDDDVAGEAVAQRVEG